MTVTQSTYAALQWLREQLRMNTPKPWRIFAPKLLPYIPLVVQRIDACLEEPLDVHVPGGFPLAGSPALARLEKLTAALRANLAAPAVAELMPYLRRGLGDAGIRPDSWLPRMSVGRALSLLQASGACGDATGPHRWHEPVAALAQHAAEEIAAAKQLHHPSEHRNATIRRQDAERMAGELRALLPALRELDLLADQLARGGMRKELVELYWRFVRRWLVVPATHSFMESIGRSLCAAASASNQYDVSENVLQWLQAQFREMVLELPLAGEPDIIVSVGDSVEPGVTGFVIPAGIDEREFAMQAESVLPGKGLWGGGKEDRVSVPVPWPTARRNEPGFAGLASVGVVKEPITSLGHEWSKRWGLHPERPLSATALPSLLTCPYRFLLERIAHVHPSPHPASTQALDPTAFGALVHDVFAAFLKRFGREFCAGHADVPHWQERISRLAAEHFEGFLRSYPLWGDANHTRELLRLQSALQELVAAEWRLEPCEFLAAEHRFGEPRGLNIQAREVQLYIRGAIDWLVRTPRGIAVRELKTTATRVTEPVCLDARRALQLGLYVLAVEGGALGDPEPVADAAVVIVSPGGVQRWAVVGKSLQELRSRTLEAIEVAVTLLQSGKFPRTPAMTDCFRCPFFAYCGEEAVATASCATDADAQKFYAWRTASSVGFAGSEQR